MFVVEVCQRHSDVVDQMIDNLKCMPYQYTRESANSMRIIIAPSRDMRAIDRHEESHITPSPVPLGRVRTLVKAPRN